MDQATTFISLGVILVGALVADRLAQRSPLPQVTVLLLFGVAVGPAGLDLLPAARESWEPVVTDLALVMVGFLVGSDLEWGRLRDHARSILLLATVAASVTAVVVAVGLLLFGQDVRLALALGGIAAATAPAATLAVVDELRAEGPLTRSLLGIVAVDDALSITLFSILLAAAATVTGDGAVGGIVWDAAREIGGGVLLGLAIGGPAAALSGRIRPGRPTLLEAFVLVFLTAGIGDLLQVSFLLAAIVAGAVVVNTARHHDRPFNEIERIDWPFLAVFFVLGGASFDLQSLQRFAGIIGLYVLLRAVGRLGGGALGSLAAPYPVRPFISLTLLPQAGVAIGLALLAAERFPEIGGIVVPVVVVSTVVFELLGPVATRFALQRTGEVGVGQDRV